MAQPVPVFLFLGFLGSGKTSLINALLAENGLARIKTLLILTEEGETLLNLPESFRPLVTVRTLEDPEDMNRETLLQWQRDATAQQVLIEYNGMWPLEILSKSAPGNWIFMQTALTADSNTFPVYNANLRSLAADKLRSCTMTMFNRVQDEDAVPNLRRLVRAVNRKADVYYEYDSGECDKDESNDMLPYDLSSKAFRVEDEAFAIWQLDIRSFPERYNGKTVTVRTELFPGHLIGRRVMTCCEADVEQILFSVADEQHLLPLEGWAWVTAQIEVADQTIQLRVLSATAATAPASEVAIF
jgi:hypothetical protein